MLNAEAVAKSLSNNQLERIADGIIKSWRFRLVFIFVFVVSLLLSVPTGIMIAVRIANKKIEESANSVLEESQRRLSSTTNETAHQFQAFLERTTNQIAEAYDTITNQIAERFKEPRIQKVVEDVANTEAKAVLEQQVQPTVDRFRADVDFLRTATKARAYDYRAYLRLIDLAKNTNDLALLADQVIAETDRSLERDALGNLQRHLVVYSGTNMYDGPFSTDELANHAGGVFNDRIVNNREGFVSSVLETKQLLFLPLLVDLLTNETDLLVADRLAAGISSLTKQDFHPRDFGRILKWWGSHAVEYTNWPFAELQQAERQFGACDYESAAKMFERVIKIDPMADGARCQLIFCLYELGRTNQAAELTKGFTLPAGRWAEAARIKADLETGSVSNATFQYVKLTRDQPAFLIFGKYYHLWRHIDWQLAEKLSSKEK